MLLTLLMSIENEDDRSFVEILYLTYEKKLYMMAESILHNRYDAQDCVHEVICAVMRHIEFFEAKSETDKKRLLAVCCRNEAFKIYNRRKKDLYMQFSMTQYGESEADGDSQLDIEDPDSDVRRLVIHEENVRLLRRLVDELSPIYRDVIQLRYYDRLSTVEIADLLGITDNLVRMRLKRAKRILLEKGGDELYEAYCSDGK